MNIRDRIENSVEDEGRELLYTIAFNSNIKSMRQELVFSLIRR